MIRDFSVWLVAHQMNKQFSELHALKLLVSLQLSRAGILQAVQWLLWTGRSGVWAPVGPRGFFFFFFKNLTDRLWGPPRILVSGYRGSFPGLKRPGRKVDRSSPSTAEVNEWSYTSTTPCMRYWRGQELTFVFTFWIGGNRGSSVGIVTRQRAGRLGSRLSIPSRRERYLCSVKRVDRSCGQSGVCSVSGTQRREVDRSQCISKLLEIVCGNCMAWTLIKHGDNFTYVSSCLSTSLRWCSKVCNLFMII